MNIHEKNTVINYLKSKKLSYPLYKEVLDHFFAEVELMMSKGSGFQEAFVQTKMKWHTDFQLVAPHALSIKKIPRIEARVLKSHFRSIFGLANTAAIYAMLLMTIYQPIGSLLLVGLLLMLIGLFIFMVIQQKISISDYIRMQFHPVILRSFLFSGILFIASYFLPQMLTWFSSSRLDLKAAMQMSVMVYVLVIQIQLLLFQKSKIKIIG